MLCIGCQYQAITKVKKKKADLPYLSFLQDEIGNTHIFFCLRYNIKVLIISNKNHNKLTITVSLVL